MRTFDTGATRDGEDGKLDYEGFLSPLTIKRYAQYMHAHRKQSDGKMRDSDNWQKGIPLVAYMKSLIRHVFDLWFLHRGMSVSDNRDGHGVSKEETLCAVIFNASGYLHELLKDKRVAESARASAPPLAEVATPDYSEVCHDCAHSSRSCSESSKPLQDPCPGKERSTDGLAADRRFRDESNGIILETGADPDGSLRIAGLTWKQFDVAMEAIRSNAHKQGVDEGFEAIEAAKRLRQSKLPVNEWN